MPFLPHPEDKERQGVVIGGASLWMIDGKSEEEQKAAWEFMKYLQTPEVQAEWHVGTGYFAINPAAYEEQVVKDAHAEKPQLKVQLTNYNQQNLLMQHKVLNGYASRRT